MFNIPGTVPIKISSEAAKQIKILNHFVDQKLM